MRHLCYRQKNMFIHQEMIYEYIAWPELIELSKLFCYQTAKY